MEEKSSLEGQSVILDCGLTEHRSSDDGLPRQRPYETRWKKVRNKIIVKIRHVVFLFKKLSWNFFIEE